MEYQKGQMLALLNSLVVGSIDEFKVMPIGTKHQKKGLAVVQALLEVDEKFVEAIAELHGLLEAWS